MQSYRALPGSISGQKSAINSCEQVQQGEHKDAPPISPTTSYGSACLRNDAPNCLVHCGHWIFLLLQSDHPRFIVAAPRPHAERMQISRPVLDARITRRMFSIAIAQMQEEEHSFRRGTGGERQCASEELRY